MGQIRWIRHMGMTIYYQDLSGSKSREESLTIIKASIDTTAKQKPKSLYAITEVTGSYFDAEIIRWVHKAFRENEKAMLHEAVVGMSALQATVFNNVRKLVKRSTYAAKDMADAKRWLFERYREDQAKKR